MDFHYGTSFGKASPEAYERLLLDAMSGDATLFARRDEVEASMGFHRSHRRSMACEKGCARVCSFTLPDRGDRKQRMICSPVTAGRWRDYDRCPLSLKHSR